MPPSAEPIRVYRILAGFDRPWYIAGGWAVDLHLGRITRAHKDIEVTILRRDQARLREHLSGWSFEQVVKGRLEQWREGEFLAVPVHEIHARGPGRGPLSLEVLLNDAAGNDWVFRRDPRIRRPLRTVGRVTPEGIPYLRPEIVLLFKAKSADPVDELDFVNLIPSMDRPQRDWLREALSMCDSSHPWIARLSRLPEKL